MCEYELIKHVTDRPHHVPGNCCLKGAQQGLSLISSWFCVGVTDVSADVDNTDYTEQCINHSHECSHKQNKLCHFS